MKGFLAEMQAHGAGAQPPALAAADDWVVMAGADDPLYDFETSRDFWRTTLPGATISIVPDGGRWLHLTHIDAIVAALASVAARW
jgi:pimeloyl-ACP methyl ester carboxylesterase